MAKLCNAGIQNTGTAITPQKTVTKKVIFGNYFDNTGNPNAILFSRPGTVSTAGSTTLTGSGTKFTKLKVGDPIMIAGESRRYIAAISSDTSITLDKAAVTTASGLAYNVFNAAFFTAFINHTDTSRRMYPSTPVKNATDKRDASIKQTFDDQTEVIVNQAIRKVNMLIVGADATPQLAQKLRSGRYSNNGLGFWEIDKDGNIWGMLNTDGQLDQRRVDQNTLDVIFNPADDKTTPSIEIMFDILSTESDDNIACIANCDTENDVNSNIFKGLLDVTGKVSDISVDGFTLELDTIYGSAPAPVTDKGLLVTDFKGNTGTAGKIYRENDTPGDVTITSVTERKNVNGEGTGIYDVVIPTATSGDILALKIIRDGRDYASVNQILVIIP